MNYERFVAWVAGPNSAIVGFLTMKLANAKFLGSLHIGKAAVAHAIFDVATFLGGAVTTYAGHHKWLSNIAKWWEHVASPLPADLGEEIPPPAGPETLPVRVPKPDTAVPPDVDESERRATG